MVRFTSFRDFYPWYLGEHSDPVCRRLHIVGTALALAAMVAALATRRWWLLLAGALAGYGLAWLGHSRFERNSPATFSYPLYSLLGDLAMFRDVPRCSAPPDPVAPDPFPGTRGDASTPARRALAR